jgi:hypothetical protein
VTVTSGATDAIAAEHGSERVLRSGLALALLVYLAFAARFWFVTDDAFISFRYSRHLVEGHGLVYNTSESPPVEGYTNFLWVLWIALAELVGLDPRAFANVTSIVCGAVLILAVTRFARRTLALGKGSSVALALFRATMPPVVVWATGGLETMAFALACFLVFERLCAGPRARGAQAGIAALAASLLRADGPAYVLMILGAVALGWLRPLARAQLRQLVPCVAILVAGVTVHVLWRRSYYHDWLPNTAYVKAGLTALRLERGLKYLVVMCLTVPTLALVPLAGLVAGSRASALLRVRCALVALGVYAYAAFSGGDWMPMARFLLPAVPFVALSFAALLAALPAAPRIGRGALLVTSAALVLHVLPLFDLHVFPFAFRERFHFRWNDPVMLSEFKRWDKTFDMPKRMLFAHSLARYTTEADSMPLIGIGIVGYYTEIQLLDQCGLVTPVVARRPTPPARASPGHDRYVPARFFLPARPTILRAWLAEPGSVLEGQELIDSGAVRYERHELPESGGKWELRIMRIPPDSPLLPP